MIDFSARTRFIDGHYHFRRIVSDPPEKFAAGFSVERQERARPVAGVHRHSSSDCLCRQIDQGGGDLSGAATRRLIVPANAVYDRTGSLERSQINNQVEYRLTSAEQSDLLTTILTFEELCLARPNCSRRVID
ncbi:hypothetical protein MesoLjLc_21980 [Mesorhizobium sp. L-8-10]|uniref:hypothetical protein n=1 Tax=Mesorhizobium sp. L-8-10 TaxID=2744523 RepID=UPI001936ABBC|nr:hypothetical protein [Mesorhizobium sp. L-8-10]BCH30268.1 hypothetical protein MesoLjLc_21980 [Mesorhizobium sp. L-8-10]